MSHTLDTSKRSQTINLGAGPSSLPTPVLLQSAQDIIDYENSGMGLIELSHRSGTFKTILDSAESNLRKLLDIPDDYAVLFTQGGGTEQFSATALNLIAHHAAKNPGYVAEHDGKSPPIDYLISGSWSSKAYKEAQRLGFTANAAFDVKKSQGKFGSIPPVDQWKLSDAVKDKPAMLYYCDNETVDGVEFPSPGLPIDQLPKEYRDTVPIVADCSSNILSRPIDIKAHSIVFFGAQKNVGPPGVTVVIIRKSLLDVHPDEGVPHGGPRLPTTLVYKNLADNASLYNTPPMFSIHVSGLVFKRLLEQEGGVSGSSSRSDQKSSLIYTLLDSPQSIYIPTVSQATARSRMNVTFRITSQIGSTTPDDKVEDEFVKYCKANGIEQVKGHRSVGGIRTSLYNAVTVEQTKKLEKVMIEFQQQLLNQ
ncbi:unnamed protein product [Sympodiomycopsis kandeliae]